MALRLIPMMGYEVCVERMPGRRWKSALLCSNMWLYSSDFTVWVQCFFKGRVWLKVVCKVHAWCSGWACNFCNLWEEMVVALEDKGLVIGG